MLATSWRWIRTPASATAKPAAKATAISGRSVVMAGAECGRAASSAANHLRCPVGSPIGWFLARQGLCAGERSAVDSAPFPGGKHVDGARLITVITPCYNEAGNV